VYVDNPERQQPTRLQSCRRLVVAAACLLLLLSAGCSGGQSTGVDRTDARLTFLAPPERSVFASGSAEFSMSPALDDNERLVCTLDGSLADPCATGPASGEIRYENLPVGLHRFSVDVRTEDGRLEARAEYFLEVVEPTVVVFGANPGGITAAVAAARAGQLVALVEPTPWVGGMMSAGLAKTDTGARGHEIIGGMTAEFFQRVRDAELAKGVCFGPCAERFDFEPHVAERVFEEMIEESRVVLERAVELVDVEKEGATILGLLTSRGRLGGRIFVDASYEGDLMALAGIPYRIGREPLQSPAPPDDPELLELYEEHAGTPRYRVPLGSTVDPYRVPGDPSSGTLPFIEPRPETIPSPGTGDSRVMAYTFRLCVTDDPANRRPFTRPEGYDPYHYEAHARLAQVLALKVDLAELMFNPGRTVLSSNSAYFKYDLNGGSTFSTDMTAPGLNQAYAEADEMQRETIRNAYRRYIEGLLYTWQTDPRFGSLNAEVSRFGYCTDEFVDRGGWPHKLYDRISRRMVGEYMMNENDVLQNGRRPAVLDTVGFGAYGLDMHTHRYFAAPVNWPDGDRRDAIVLEGFLIEHLPDDEPYPISYRALVPRAEDAVNLINPVTLSATQVAYSSIRMEPTFMILGESAGIAAALAIESNESVQSLSYERLRQQLLARGQRLDN
jgi:hypothetical protein